MNKRYILYLLLILVFADLSYSFLQHYHTPLDGDMAGGIVPAKDVQLILQDPFGISVLTDDAVYPNPNRYFAHATFYTYFNTVPLGLQTFVSPIDSVYLSTAIAKTSIQLLFLILLSFYITGSRKLTKLDFWIGAILIVPLFQINGYRSYMGIIDPATTYTFFYALPTVLLLLFYYPFFSDSFYGTKFLKNFYIKTLLFLLAVYIVFSGVLNPGVILIVSLLFGVNSFLATDKKTSLSKRVVITIQSIPKAVLILFSWACLLSLYALFIDKNNSIFLGETVSIGERYARLSQGLLTILTQKIGFPLLLLIIGINIVLVRRLIKSDESRKTLRLFQWIGIFSLVYILLLPLGGYKEYRPNILRYDTFIPITLGLIFIYAKSSFQLIHFLSGRRKTIYLGIILIISFVFTFADKPEFTKNQCERKALEQIANSTDEIVFLEADCTVLSWEKINNPEDSELNAKLLKRWNVTKTEKLYYQLK